VSQKAINCTKYVIEQEELARISSTFELVRIDLFFFFVCGPPLS
jgi:hypothetical protein